MNKDLKVGLLLSVFILTIVIFISKDSFAYEYTRDNYTLFYKEDYNLLKEDIKTYIDHIDNYLIPNTSYNYSDILRDNYDFLTNFALDYIINNRELYQDEIKEITSYTYNDLSNNKKTTNEYIDIEEIYKITLKYFGVDNYYIINDNTNIINNKISLTDYTDRLFTEEIKDVNVEKEDNLLLAKVNYMNGDKYKYIFSIENNVLKIYNIEVDYE